MLGSRPQFVKAGSVSSEMFNQVKFGRDISEVIIHIGQHYDVNVRDVFFEKM
jgi:UDP-GlcNAc3NAcA epimerase